MPKVKKIYIGTNQVRPYRFNPWANTLAYYTFNNTMNNYSGLSYPDWVLNTAQFSTTQKHWNNEYSLYCNGSTYAYLPASSLFEWGSSDRTISVWLYSLTNTWQYTWFMSNYAWATPNYALLRKWWRLSDRFNNSNQLNFCWNAWSNSDIWVDVTWWPSLYNTWWHNVVFTRISWVIKIYLDGELKLTNSSYTTNSMWLNNNINLWWNRADNAYSNVYMNDLIIEDRWWTEQEVADYYTLAA